jgi:GTP cyclohydrolase II
MQANADHRRSVIFPVDPVFSEELSRKPDMDSSPAQANPPDAVSGGAGLPAGRQVRRAIQDARAGLPVIIRGTTALLALPAETATEAALLAFARAAAGPSVLLLAPTRAAALLHHAPEAADIASLALPPGAITPALLMSLANPIRPQSIETQAEAPAPALAAPAILLAKLARLLPAMLVAPAAADLPASLLAVQDTDLLGYPALEDASLVRVAEAAVPLAVAPDARLVAFRPADGGLEHLALLIGRPEQAAAPLVRIHSECFTGDILGSLRCDCGPQLHQAMRRMAAEGAGVLLYMAQEGRGIGLANKLRAYALQDTGLDTLDANRALGWGADERSFAPAAAMLNQLGITRIRLLTNNPEKLAQLAAHGIEVTARVRHAIAANGVNDAYLETKARRFGHMLE